MSKYVQYFIVLLLLPSFINGDRNDWFQMDTPYGSLTFNEKGWARPVNGENEKPVLFEEFVDTNGKIYIQVMSGNYAGYYLSGDVKEGVGAYKKWDDASYFKWNGCHLENLSLRVAGLQLVYGPNGYFYFYTVAPQYPLMCITKKYPNRVSENKCQPTSVEGMWKYMFTIPGKTSRQLKIGATKTHKESTTSEWSQGVSITSKNSLTIKGVFETGVDLTADIRKTLANTHETELSTNTEETWTVEFGENDRGKALWQFIFNIKDTCDHNEQIFVKEYAITQKKRNPPCCLPGYSSDGLNYGVCDSADALIEKSDKHCTVSISRRSLISYT